MDYVDEIKPQWTNRNYGNILAWQRDHDAGRLIMEIETVHDKKQNNLNEDEIINLLIKRLQLMDAWGRDLASKRNQMASQHAQNSATLIMGDIDKNAEVIDLAQQYLAGIHPQQYVHMYYSDAYDSAPIAIFGSEDDAEKFHELHGTGNWEMMPYFPHGINGRIYHVTWVNTDAEHWTVRETSANVDELGLSALTPLKFTTSVIAEDDESALIEAMKRKDWMQENAPPNQRYTTHLFK